VLTSILLALWCRGKFPSSKVALQLMTTYHKIVTSKNGKKCIKVSRRCMILHLPVVSKIPLFKLEALYMCGLIHPHIARDSGIILSSDHIHIAHLGNSCNNKYMSL